MSLAVLNPVSKHTSTVSAQAFAKINLALAVLGKRNDGFHEIASIAIGVELADSVACRLRDDDQITIDCNDSSLVNSENLAVRAARAFAEYTGAECGLDIRIEKHIPIGGGLGGGSSDAATTLILFNKLSKTDLSRDELARIGAQIGSDVPLFFHLPSARMSGRGEQVEPIKLAWRGWVLLVFADAFVSTPLTYQAWAHTGAKQNRPVDVKAMSSLRRARELDSFLFNDLEEAVFHVSPEVAKVYRALSSLDLGPFRVSGAGSTLFRLFDEVEEAHHAAKKIHALDENVRTSIVAGPVGESFGS